MDQYEDWMVELHEHVARIRINRSDTMNDLTMNTLQELRNISLNLAARDDIWVVIVEGEGDHFSSGMELNVFTEQLDGSKDDLQGFVREQQSCLEAFEELEKVTIAKLKGFCIGGGLLITMCCDFRIASQRTIFCLPEIKLGIPIFWGTSRITRILGLSMAKEMILLGKKYRAKEAYRMGLVHEVVPGGNLEKAVSSLAERFTRIPPKTAGLAKRLTHLSYELSMKEIQEEELAALEELLESPDLVEAIESYMLKRSPNFIGR